MPYTIRNSDTISADVKGNEISLNLTRSYATNSDVTNAINNANKNFTDDIDSIKTNINTINGKIETNTNKLGELDTTVGTLEDKVDKLQAESFPTDDALSTTSTNAVQNKVVTSALNNKANASHKHTTSDITGVLSSDNIPTITDSKIESMDASKLTGTVPSEVLPSYVDDVIEGYYYNEKFYSDSSHSKSISGEAGKIYVSLDTNKTYRYSGSIFVVISETLALGETSSTAYRGDRGKTAYSHASSKGSAFASVLGKVTTNSEGHVTGITPIVKSDITGLGVPAQDTTYSKATSTTDGLESKEHYSKIEGIADGAEVNQNAFSSVVVGSTTVSADSKTDTLTLVAGSNVTLSADATNDKVTITAKDTTYSNATSSASGLMSSSDKAKLDGIEEGANNYSLPTATSNVLGGVKVGDNITNTNGEISISKDNVIKALGYTPEGSAGSVVTFEPSLTSGTKVGTITIDGTDTDMYAPTNTDTHYTTGLIVGASATATANAAASNGSVYLNVKDNSTIRNSHKIVGTGATTVTSDASGNITINSSNSTYTALKNPNALTISLNGTSQGAYDGSSAKSIDITPSTIGAAAISHKHSADDITSGTLSADRLPSITSDKITSLDSSKLTGTIPESLLPSYVDDVIEGYYYSSAFYSDSAHTTAITGETGKIYVDLSTNKTYRYSGSGYVVISETIALGETSSTAYRGDRGKTAYEHASAKGTAYASGLYKITTNAQGHVTNATAVTKSDITALGIPAQDTNTTYSNATTSVAGLMSATDKTKLDSIASGANAYTLPTASSSVLGGIKTGSNITNTNGTISLTRANITSALGYTPPTTNTTYSTATTSADGLMSSTDKTELDKMYHYLQSAPWPFVRLT